MRERRVRESVRPTAVRLAALAVTALVRLTHAQSDPVELRVDNYTVVYMQDKSDLRWNFTEAQEYCQQRFGTSLASFHQVGSIRDVYQAIDGARGEDHSGTRVRYRFGLHCEEKFVPEYGGYKGKRSLPLWQYSDGTRFDYGFGSESVMSGDFTWDSRCPHSLTMDATTNRNYPWDLKVFIERTSAMICNFHMDDDWQSMNPPRTEFIICDENKDCILDCSQPPQCPYYRNTGIRNMKSLTVRMKGQYGGYGMTIAVSNVASVSVRASGAFYSALSGAAMSFSNCTDVSVIGYPQKSLRAGLFIFNMVGTALFQSEYFSGRYVTLIANNSGQVRVACQSPNSCQYMSAEFTDVHSVTYLCSACHRGIYVFRQVTEVDIHCDYRVNEIYKEGCQYSRFSIDGSNVTEPTSVNISCFGVYSCEARDWTIKAYDTATLSCQSENSCDLGAPFGSVFTLIPNVIVDCETSGSCTPLWTVEQPVSLSTFESFSLRCHASKSCYFDFPLIFVDNRPFHFELHSMAADSFNLGLFGNVSEPSTIAEDRKVRVFCEDFRSCSDDESEETPLGSIVADASGYEVSLVVECRGRESCVGSDLSVLSEQSGISVVCSGQKSCDSARVNGYCARMTDVRITAVIEDMTVICPSTLTSDSCRVLIQKGQLSNSRIGMLLSHWDSDKFSLEGQSDAFVQVTSLHLDSDEQDSCEEAGSASQAECFLVFNGNRRWIESLSCSNFVMSLYSPMTILVGSLTTLFGVLFLISAMNQPDSNHHRKSDAEITQSEEFVWLRNAMSVTVLLLSLMAVVCSFILLSHESKSRSKISSGDFPPIPQSFRLCCSLFAACLFAFISFVEAWLIVSENTQWNPAYGYLRRLFILEDNHNPNRIAVGMTTLRMVQMLIYYVVSPLSIPIAIAVCISVDLFLILPSRLLVVWLWCSLVWLFSSQYSPLILGNSELTFFQVITNGTDDESLQVWFDVIIIGMLFCVGSLVLTARSFHDISKEQSMFLQFFDLATDLTVLAYWLSNGLWLWASIQSVILVSTCVIQWSVLRDDLHHWKEHLMIVTGLGRGYTKIRLWFGKDDRWLSIDRRCSLLETFYESAPSVMFGLYAFLSDVWESHLSGNTSNRVSKDVGPLLISMLITGMAIASKTIQYSLSLSMPFQIKVALFFFTLSDFVVRILPLAVLFALLQSDSDNHTVSLGLMVGFPLILLVSLAEQSAVIYHCTIHEHTWQRLSVMYALPLSLTSSPILFHSLQTPGLPLYFDFQAFLKSHLMVAFQSLILMAVSIAIEPQCFLIFLGPMISFVCCLITNLIGIPIIWNINHHR